MSEDKKTLHVYDGIAEENNPMPSWWIWLFILCCIFGFIYWLHFQSGGGPTLKQEYEQALKDYQEKADKNAANTESETEESLMAFMKSEKAIHEGSEIFAAKCAICHGASLEGKIGPNLTDNFWSTGDGTRTAVIHTIRKGSAVKGMPAWETQMKPIEIKEVAAFVYSKIGSNPPNPKAPEGVEVKK
jgi:cytochrome c oxidase cbb3-type subunit III